MALQCNILWFNRGHAWQADYLEGWREIGMGRSKGNWVEEASGRFENNFTLYSPLACFLGILKKGFIPCVPMCLFRVSTAANDLEQ